MAPSAQDQWYDIKHEIILSPKSGGHTFGITEAKSKMTNEAKALYMFLHSSKAMQELPESYRLAPSLSAELRYFKHHCSAAYKLEFHSGDDSRLAFAGSRGKSDSACDQRSQWCGEGCSSQSLARYAA